MYRTMVLIKFHFTNFTQAVEAHFNTKIIFRNRYSYYQDLWDSFISLSFSHWSHQFDWSDRRRTNEDLFYSIPDSKVHGANMGPTWAPCWPHEPCYQGWWIDPVGPMKQNHHATDCLSNFLKYPKWPPIGTLSTLSSLCQESLKYINTLRPRLNGRHFPDDIFNWILLNGNAWIPI